MSFKDLTGQRFGRLTVISRAENYVSPQGIKLARWNCLCDCGNQKIAVGAELRKGNIRSCGCFQKEVAKNRLTKHGLTSTRLYGVWQDMRQGCLNPNSKAYKYYGGRGITVCDEWKDDFKAFYDWAMENGYKEEIMPSGYNYWTIERINNDGNFEPDNCCWANRVAQGNNRQNNHLIEQENEVLTLAQTAKQKGVSRITLGARMSRYGWSTNDSLNTPIGSHKRHNLEYQGETLSVSQCSEKFNINANTIYERIRNGLSLQEAVQTPLSKPQKYEYKGKEYGYTEIQKVFGINATTFVNRVKRGMAIEEAIETELLIPQKYSYNGVEYTAPEIYKKFGIRADTFRFRLKKGMTVAEAIETPINKQKSSFAKRRLAKLKGE